MMTKSDKQVEEKLVKLFKRMEKISKMDPKEFKVKLIRTLELDSRLIQDTHSEMMYKIIPIEYLAGKFTGEDLDNLCNYENNLLLFLWECYPIEELIAKIEKFDKVIEKEGEGDGQDNK